MVFPAVFCDEFELVSVQFFFFFTSNCWIWLFHLLKLLICRSRHVLIETIKNGLFTVGRFPPWPQCQALRREGEQRFLWIWNFVLPPYQVGKQVERSLKKPKLQKVPSFWLSKHAKTDRNWYSNISLNMFEPKLVGWYSYQTTKLDAYVHRRS